MSRAELWAVSVQHGWEWASKGGTQGVCSWGKLTQVFWALPGSCTCFCVREPCSRWGSMFCQVGLSCIYLKFKVHKVHYSFLLSILNASAGKEMTFNSHSINCYHLSPRKWLKSGVKDVRGKEKDNLERYTALSQSLLVTCANGVCY